MPLSKSEAALRQVVEGKAPLKTKLAALAEMTSPSARWLSGMLSKPDLHSKLRLALSKRLADVHGNREVRQRQEEINKLLAEEAARPVPSVVQKLDVEPQPSLGIAVEAAKQRMGAGVAAAARRLASKGQEKQQREDIKQLLAEEAARQEPSAQIKTLPAIKAATQSEAGRVAKPQARASSTANQPVPAEGPDVASKETSLVEPKPAWPYPVYWDAFFNSQSGRGSGFDLEREIAIRQLEEQDRKKAREKDRDPYWGKTPLGSW